MSRPRIMVAADLGISQGTVEYHQYKMMTDLGM